MRYEDCKICEKCVARMTRSMSRGIIILQVELKEKTKLKESESAPTTTICHTYSWKWWRKSSRVIIYPICVVICIRLHIIRCGLGNIWIAIFTGISTIYHSWFHFVRLTFFFFLQLLWVFSLLLQRTPFLMCEKMVFFVRFTWYSYNFKQTSNAWHKSAGLRLFLIHRIGHLSINIIVCQYRACTYVQLSIKIPQN